MSDEYIPNLNATLKDTNIELEGEKGLMQGEETTKEINCQKCRKWRKSPTSKPNVTREAERGMTPQTKSIKPTVQIEVETRMQDGGPEEVNLEEEPPIAIGVEQLVVEPTNVIDVETVKPQGVLDYDTPLLSLV